jgi:hypothetical protein
MNRKMQHNLGKLLKLIILTLGLGLVLLPIWYMIITLFTLPPFKANSIRPACVRPRLAPSPTTFTRNSSPVTRRASFAGSPTWASVWLLART